MGSRLSLLRFGDGAIAAPAFLPRRRRKNILRMADDPIAATAALRQHLGQIVTTSTAGICPAIHADDEMFTYPIRVLGRSAAESVVEYFQVGSATFAMLTQTLAWLGRSWPRVGRVLDFASGYGRVSRFLARAGCAQVVISDILAPAVAFQRQALGVTGFVSASRPDEVDLQGPYDFIAVISLFSHLPRPTFAGWLARLCTALAPGGAMLFTTHGEMAYAQSTKQKLAPSAFIFHRASESERLGKSEYGSTFVHPSHVQALIAKMPSISLLGFVPHGLNDHQDVFVVGRQCQTPREPLRFVPIPKVCIDVAERGSDGSLRAAGWALDGPCRAPVRAVTLFLGNQLAIAAEIGQARPDLVSVFRSERASAGGWQATARLPEPTPAWLTALAEDEQGLRGFCCRPLPT